MARKFSNKKRDLESVPARDVQCSFSFSPKSVSLQRLSLTCTPARFTFSRAQCKTLCLEPKHIFSICTPWRSPPEWRNLADQNFISASVPGKGAGSAKGQLAFDPLRQNPRAALLLTNGTLYLAWASSCDLDPYHGWVMAYDPQTLQQIAVLNTTPDGDQGGIWASDTGLGADNQGKCHVPTGNGTFDASSGGRDYGDSVLKLGLEGSSIVIRDYFTPYDEARLNDADADLGSSGSTLLPDQPEFILTSCYSQRKAQ